MCVVVVVAAVPLDRGPRATLALPSSLSRRAARHAPVVACLFAQGGRRVAVQSLHDARRVRQATLFQRRASFSPGGGATTPFAVPPALRLRRRSAGSGGWPWSCSSTTGGGLRLWPYRSAFDFDRRWRATAVALPHRRP